MCIPDSTKKNSYQKNLTVIIDLLDVTVMIKFANVYAFNPKA
tara:strand:+ start:270 stop:395 length:126 start_codon:yes stop_codon:yes gene_type:complete